MEKEKIIPNLFIVGSQKAGTSSLRDWLNQHPDVWFLMDLEPNLFADDVEGCEDYNDKNWYLSLFPKNLKETYIGEKSARYLYSKESAKRIKEFNPKAKIIIILREPAEMIFSSFRHLRRSGLEPIEDFEKALSLEEERKRKFGTKFLRNFFYKESADYYSQVKRYFDEFGKKNVKVVILEEIKENPQKVYDEICEFLKISKFKPDFKILNVGDKAPKNAFFSRSFYFLNNLPRPLKNFIKKISTHKFRNLVKGKGLKSAEKHPEINENIRRKINLHFSNNIKKLEKLIGKNLDFWYKWWTGEVISLI